MRSRCPRVRAEHVPIPHARHVGPPPASRHRAGDLLRQRPGAHAAPPRSPTLAGGAAMTRTIARTCLPLLASRLAQGVNGANQLFPAQPFVGEMLLAGGGQPVVLRALTFFRRAPSRLNQSPPFEPMECGIERSGLDA